MTHSPRPPRIVRWLACSERLLGQAAPRLNALNVFPVPDADTGSNMHATMAAAHAAVADVAAGPVDIGGTLERAGAAALSSAQGNSGTLMAVMVSGMADPLRGHEGLTAVSLAEALLRADTAARSALSDPREGTILSVLGAARASVQETLRRAAAEDRPAATRAVLEEAVTACVRDARAAVQQTEGQLDELARASVVDAGAVGLLLVFEALRCVMLDEEPDATVAHGLRGYAEGLPAAAAPAGEEGVEVMCTIELDPLGAATLRHRLTEVGDSVIVAPTRRGDDPQDPVPWRVHVHVPEAAAAETLLREAGEPQDLSVSDLTGDHSDHHHGGL